MFLDEGSHVTKAFYDTKESTDFEKCNQDGNNGEFDYIPVDSYHVSSATCREKESNDSSSFFLISL